MALASTDQQWHAVGQCMWLSTQLVVMIRVLLLRVAVVALLTSMNCALLLLPNTGMAQHSHPPTAIELRAMQRITRARGAQPERVQWMRRSLGAH
jgi:hypothetical protein